MQLWKSHQPRQTLELTSTLLIHLKLASRSKTSACRTQPAARELPFLILTVLAVLTAFAGVRTASHFNATQKERSRCALPLINLVLFARQGAVLVTGIVARAVVAGVSQMLTRDNAATAIKASRITLALLRLSYQRQQRLDWCTFQISPRLPVIWLQQAASNRS